MEKQCLCTVLTHVPKIYTPDHKAYVSCLVRLGFKNYRNLLLLITTQHLHSYLNAKNVKMLKTYRISSRKPNWLPSHNKTELAHILHDQQITENLTG